MDEREILAKNIYELRCAAGLTQLAFAERLNYSDKAVSKWERGESVPDVFMLKRIAELFGVSVDYLLEREHDTPGASMPQNEKKKRAHRYIILLSTVGVFVLAAMYFAVHSLFIPDARLEGWLSFIYAVPISLATALVLLSVWGRSGWLLVVIGGLVLGVVLSVYLTLLSLYSVSLWQLYLICVPTVAVLLVASRLASLRRGNIKNEE